MIAGAALPPRHLLRCHIVRHAHCDALAGLSEFDLAGAFPVCDPPLAGIAHRGAAYAEGIGDGGLGREEGAAIHLRMVAKDFEGLFPRLAGLAAGAAALEPVPARDVWSRLFSPEPTTSVAAASASRRRR